MEKKINGKIYKITNTINDKIYIGQTIASITDRWYEHSSPARPSQKGRRSAIQAAMTLYGKDNFSIKQINSADTMEKLNALEMAYIADLNTLSPNGYNLLPGGDNKRCHEETKAKISAKLKGRPIANRYTGGNASVRTEAQKAHLSVMNTGVPNKALFQAVQCIETGQVFESINACAAHFGVVRQTISGLIKSGKKGRVGSFRFV